MVYRGLRDTSQRVMRWFNDVITDRWSGILDQPSCFAQGQVKRHSVALLTSSVTSGIGYSDFLPCLSDVSKVPKHGDRRGGDQYCSHSGSHWRWTWKGGGGLHQGCVFYTHFMPVLLN